MLWLPRCGFCRSSDVDVGAPADRRSQVVGLLLRAAQLLLQRPQGRGRLRRLLLHAEVRFGLHGRQRHFALEQSIVAGLQFALEGGNLHLQLLLVWQHY